MAGRQQGLADLCTLWQFGLCVCVCAAREWELIIRFVHSRGKAGGRTGYLGSEELGLSKSDQGRTKVNKGDTEQDTERNRGRGSVEMKPGKRNELKHREKEKHWLVEGLGVECSGERKYEKLIFRNQSEASSKFRSQSQADSSGNTEMPIKKCSKKALPITTERAVQ